MFPAFPAIFLSCSSLQLFLQFFFAEIHKHGKGNRESHQPYQSEKFQAKEQSRKSSQRMKSDLLAYDTGLQHIPYHQNDQIEQKYAERQAMLKNKKKNGRPGEKDTSCSQHRKDIKNSDPKGDQHRIGDSENKKSQAQLSEGDKKQKRV